MPSPETPAIIERKLREHLAPIHLEIVDESHLHAGHTGARGDGGHYAVTIVAAAFEGLASTQRHRLIYRALEEEMRGTIHALALSALTPAEWESRPAGGLRTSTAG